MMRGDGFRERMEDFERQNGLYRTFTYQTETFDTRLEWLITA